MANNSLKIYMDFDFQLKFKKLCKENDSGCVEWLGSRRSDGYGRIVYEGQTYYAHRLAYEFNNGYKLTPSDLLVHSCGNKECVNPKHLNHFNRKERKQSSTLYIDGSKFNDIDRNKFYLKVLLDEQTGCWLWKGSLSHEGYGTIGLNYNQYRAHRLSYALHYGECPADKMVCHSCDIPSCVNPEHLWLGEPYENTQDMMSKGRNKDAQRILNIHKTGRKLSEETKRKISEKHKGRLLSPMTEEKKEKLRQANLGKKYSDETKLKVSMAGRKDDFTEKNYEYKNTTRSLKAQERNRNMDYANAKIKPADIPVIRALAATHTYKSIGEMYNIDASSVSNIIKRKTWKHIP